MIILLSNDDGIQAPGIKALEQGLSKLGRIIVVAPESEQSASSHSITLHEPLRIKEVGKDRYSVSGTPTDCVTLAIHHILKSKTKPDLIVSGINLGANLADDVHYSGTVSAAMEGAISGYPSIAFSLSARGEGKCYFDVAARNAFKICKKAMERKMPHGVMLNVNFPNLPRMGKPQLTKLGKLHYDAAITFQNTDPHGRRYVWIGGNNKAHSHILGSDCNVIDAGLISITPLQVDMTYYPLLNDWAHFKI